MRPAALTVEARADELCPQDAIASNMAALGYVRDAGGEWIRADVDSSPSTSALAAPLATDWPGTAVYVRRHGRQRSRRAHAVEPQSTDTEQRE